MAFLLAVAFFAVAAAAVAVGRLILSGPGQPVAEAEVAAAVQRRTVIWRWSGVVAGTAGAVTAVLTGALGRGFMLAAPVFGLFVVAGVVVGELSVRAPARGTRRAALVVRRIADYLPTGLTRAVAVCVLMLPTAPALPDPHVEEQEKEHRTDAPAPAPDMYPMPDPGLPPPQ